MAWEISILTYQAPHKKTFDVCCRLKALGCQDVVIYATPLHYKKTFTPEIQHRPEFVSPIETSEMAQFFGYQYEKIDSVEQIDKAEGSVFLVCGAGLLPEKFVQKYRVINAHPGYIPLARGLDALKWAIYEGLPIGVTTHLIGSETDAGEIIERRTVPIHSGDTFHAVAYRQYEMEIAMLVNAIQLLDEPHQYIPGGNNPLHRRMPKDIEEQLLFRFDKYKESSSPDE